MKHPLCSAVCAASIVATLGLTPARAGTARDFLKDAITGDNSEIMLGQLGERRAATPAARSFSETLVADHTQARAEAVGFAAHLHVRPPRRADKAAMDERDRLRGLEGWSFDREFARYMVEDHQKDIAKFQKEADAGRGPTSALARHLLPTLRKHLDMAMRLNERFANYAPRQP